ncbi:MAG: hypothetical protein NC131_19780 [Roseburia sp.]|nr:hypothetical protein [Roseburia sp.]
MTLQIAITDFIERAGGEVHPIIKAEIDDRNSPSIFSDGCGKASDQCARFETLAVKIKELVENFYRDENFNLRNGAIEIIN